VVDNIAPSALTADRFCAVVHLLVRVGVKKRPPPFDFQEIRTISGAILHPADLTQHSATETCSRAYMEALLASAKTAGTVHNVPMVVLGSGKPADVDIIFMTPDYTNNV